MSACQEAQKEKDSKADGGEKKSGTAKVNFIYKTMNTTHHIHVPSK